jgi:putative MATE family efflux protein
MTIQLSDHFTYKKLLRYVLPSILMMIFTSLYCIVDGFFVSNFVGKSAFAAINLMMPILMGVSTIGFMLGTGGSAIVSKTLGEGKKKNANRYFSMIIYAAVILGTILSTVGFVFAEPIARSFGAEGDLLSNSVIYARILFVFTPAYMLQVMFQSFFVVAEKPHYSLRITLAAGFANMILDYVFIALFDWGIAGAAFATGIGYCIGAGVPIFYFARKHNSSQLKLCKAGFYGNIFVKTCTNGSSEIVSNLSMSLVGILYNLQLMKYAGEDGVAAYGILMYAGFIFVAIYIGYSMGSGPIVSFHQGAKNHEELKNMFKKGLSLMILGGIIFVTIAEIFARPLVSIFASYDAKLLEMTVRGARISLLSFLFTGINIWGSGFFTSLNDGLISAIISFSRMFVFQVVSILVLPLIFGLDGIWFAQVCADILAVIVTLGFLLKLRKKYGY